MAVKKSKNKEELIRNIYRCLLSEDHTDSDYWNKYAERKKLINNLDDDPNEVCDYCNMVKMKGNNFIYYITDNTDTEKERIFDYLNKHANEDNEKEILDLLKKIYEDLYDYLSSYYNFNNDLLDDYFHRYKYQKIANKIFPYFKNLVEEQAKERDFLLFPPRSLEIGNIDKKDSALCFVDALGVEYLSYIYKKCEREQYNFTIITTICHCNLPSVTLYNKEFIDVSDHGASRLFIINKDENLWEMKNGGERSGRCCMVDNADNPPDCAIKENDNWVLANYDRFKGGIKKGVEVHGGATLEEVIIPIIEITKKFKDIEIKILTEKINFNLREKNAHIKIFSKTKIDNVTVEVDSIRYKANTKDNQTFDIPLTELKESKEYNIKVFSNNNLLTDKLTFIAEKGGIKENKLL